MGNKIEIGQSGIDHTNCLGAVEQVFDHLIERDEELGLDAFGLLWPFKPA